MLILGREYRVVFRQDMEDFGQCHPDEGVLEVKSGVPQMAATLLHETMHAILAESGLTHLLDNNLEEAIVRAMENGLMRSGLVKVEIPT